MVLTTCCLLDRNSIGILFGRIPNSSVEGLGLTLANILVEVGITVIWGLALSYYESSQERPKILNSSGTNRRAAFKDIVFSSKIQFS